MSLAAIPTALTLALIPVQVDSMDCPQREEVEQALANLLPPASIGMPLDHARIFQQDGFLKVELAAPDGSLIAERSFEPRGTCAELAMLAAVVITAWESDVHPNYARPAAEVKSNPVAPSPSTPASPTRAGFDLGIGAGLSVAGSAQPVGSASATWIPRGSGLGFRLSGVLDGERSVELGQRQADWRRWVGGAEADWRLGRGKASLDVHGGLAMGLLSIHGVSFAVNESRTSWSAGVTLGTRLAWWTTDHFAAWLDLQGMLWLRTQKVYSASAEQDLPSLQVLVQLGVAVGRPGGR
jgi:hypothetical protein